MWSAGGATAAAGSIPPPGKTGGARCARPSTGSGREIDDFYEARASGLLKDPWAARDAYIDVIARPPAGRPRALLRRPGLGAPGCGGPGRGPTSARDAAAASARCTPPAAGSSTTWPVWNPSRTCATRPWPAATCASWAAPISSWRSWTRIDQAASNDLDEGTGADVYRRHVRTAAADVRRLTAHYAISGLFDTPTREARPFAYQVTRLDESTRRLRRHRAPSGPHSRQLGAHRTHEARPSSRWRTSAATTSRVASG